MRSILLKIVTFVSLFLLLAFVVFVVNQTAGVVRLASEVSPNLGTGVLAILLALYAILLLTPLVLYLRLPPPLAPPKTDEGPAFEQHLAALRRRLKANPMVGDQPLESREEIEAALAVLDRRGEEIVRGAAGGVFLATAVSQSGRLDALLVLGAQSRLIWRLAHHYFQRPSLGHRRRCRDSADPGRDARLISDRRCGAERAVSGCRFQSGGQLHLRRRNERLSDAAGRRHRPTLLWRAGGREAARRASGGGGARWRVARFDRRQRCQDPGGIGLEGFGLECERGV